MGGLTRIALADEALGVSAGTKAAESFGIVIRAGIPDDAIRSHRKLEPAWMLQDA
jgi:hypothetical protein